MFDFVELNDGDKRVEYLWVFVKTNKINILVGVEYGPSNQFKEEDKNIL